MVGVSSYMRAETGDIRARAIAAAHGFTRCIPLGSQINTDRAWADMCSSWTGGGRRGRWRPNETLGHINTGVPPGESLGLRRGAERCMLSPLTGARPQIKRLGNPPIRSPIRAMLALPSSSTSLYPFLLCYPHHAPPAPKPLPVVGSRTSPVADLPSLRRAPIGGGLLRRYELQQRRWRRCEPQLQPQPQHQPQYQRQYRHQNRHQANQRGLRQLQKAQTEMRRAEARVPGVHLPKHEVWGIRSPSTVGRRNRFTGPLRRRDSSRC